MSALAEQHNAINLSQGFPDFEVSPHLIELVNQHMKGGKNQYAPMGGVMSLREEISRKIEKLYGTFYNPKKEITITAGGAQALSTAIASLVREGDEVIIFTPAYDSYAPIVELHGGKAVYIKLKYPDYKVDWEEVKKMMTHRTAMFIINTPHNPTGAVFSREDMDMLGRITADSNIFVLSDEVYEHITFDGIPHQSVCAHPQLAERSIAVFSFGKTFHATGWKVGYSVAPENLMAEFRKVHQYQVFSVNTPVQFALADFLKDEENYLISSFYQHKRDFFRQLIEGSNLKPLTCKGGYFQLLDYSAVSDEKDTVFAKYLVEEHKLAAIPVSVFYNSPEHNQVLRFCFAKGDETLQKAAEIIHRL